MFLIIVLAVIGGILAALPKAKSLKTDSKQKTEKKESGLRNPDFLNRTYDYKSELERLEPKEIEKSFDCYTYRKKSSIMTKAEERCFVRLNKIYGKKFYIIPQVHLSALLNFKIKGQNWKGAFSHINGKSVDFVLINKETFTPVCAVELDDYTHEFDDRKKRDVEVERIFESAGLPLVRFNTLKDKSDREVIAYFAERINK